MVPAFLPPAALPVYPGLCSGYTLGVQLVHRLCTLVCGPCSPGGSRGESVRGQ